MFSDTRPAFSDLVEDKAAETERRFEQHCLTELLKKLGLSVKRVEKLQSKTNFDFEWLNGLGLCQPFFLRSKYMRRGFSLDNVVKSSKSFPLWLTYCELHSEALSLGMSHIGLMFSLPGTGKWVAHNDLTNVQVHVYNGAVVICRKDKRTNDPYLILEHLPTFTSTLLISASDRIERFEVYG